MSGLLELAERVERATGPDRELDRAIADLIYPPDLPGIVDPFTASLDAAMTLAPPDWHVALIGVNQSWHVRLTHTVFQSQGETTGFAVSAPLALCAAALRATHSERTER